MRKIIFLLALIFVVCLPSIGKTTTTSDGLISLNYYEDTEPGNPDRWILDITVNHVAEIQSVGFQITIENIWMNYLNDYNMPYSTSDYTLEEIHDIYGLTDTPYIYSLRLIPEYSFFRFYSIPHDTVMGTPYQGELLIGNFNVELSYVDNLGQSYENNLTLSGPVGFAAPVPEPLSMCLFAFGAFLLHRFGRSRRS